MQMKEEIKSKIKDDLTEFKSELNSHVLDVKNAADFISESLIVHIGLERRHYMESHAQL